VANSYATVAGFVQKFGDKPAIEERDANGQTVRQFVVKAIGSQKLIRITLWPEFDSVEVEAGYYVVVDGKFQVTQGSSGGEFYSVSASTVFATPSAQKAEREVVNQPTQNASQASSDDSAPF
jgi:hypothetical protein